MGHQETLEHLATNYGVQTTDSFVGDIAEYHGRQRSMTTLHDLLAEGGKLTRIRLLTERGYPYMDVSYVYGQRPNGNEVRLYDGEIDNYKLGRRTYRSEIAKQIKAAGGTYAQQQQAWDTGVYAILWG